ncbi:MAG: helix-turn-helix transcriptional regulator [Eubacteriales bacterium]|nr:helix-turn-helix transcriptional regulator [Eubacteriales bacterium]
MKLPVGERIKRLRARHAMTQDELAQTIGVTCQSVSRWELGVCYPDIELLPSLANIFGVTLDELLGMDEICGEEKRRETFTKALDKERQGDWDGAAAILREALSADPKDDGLAAELALALGRTGRRQDRTEAIVLSERVLGRCMQDKLRSTVRANLCFLYRADGQQDRAEAMARTLGHIWECREMLQPGIAGDGERAKMLARSFDIASQVLRDVAAGREIPFSLGYAPGGIGAEELLGFFEEGAK